MSPVFTFQYASVQHHAISESELIPPEVDMNSAPHQLPSSTQQLANTLVICHAEDNEVRSPAAKLEWYS